MSVRTYNPSVRVGNWNEDIQLEEDTLKDFLEKRDKGELLYQKRTKLNQMIFKEIPLSISRDGFVHYGDIVTIRCPGARDKTKYFAHVDPRCDMQLAVYPDISKLFSANKFEGGCAITGTKDLKATLRSSFVIRSCDEAKDGEPLRYEKPFYLCTLGNEGGDLYLQSDKSTFQKTVNKSRKQEVSLVSEPSFLTKWKILHFNPKMRMEYEGVPVPANEKIIFNHVYTNQDLAAEEEYEVRTPWAREYEITANTYLDSHRAEKDVNHWMIVMGVPGDPVCPVIEKDKTQESQASSS